MVAMKVLDSPESPASPRANSEDLELRMALEFALQELRRPVSASAALLEGLRAELGLKRGQSDNLDTLEHTIHSVFRQVESLGKLGPPVITREIVDLADAVRTVRLRRHPDFKKRGIRAHGLEGSIPIWANRAVIEKVLGNLIDSVMAQATGIQNLWIRGFLADRNALLVIQNDGSGWLADGSDPSGTQSLRFSAWALGKIGGRLEIGRSVSGDELVLTFPVVEHYGGAYSGHIDVL